jgi:hypothetical protein
VAPSELDLSLWPPPLPLVEAVTYVKNLHHFHVVYSCIIIYLYRFIYNIVLLLNTSNLFSYNTQFTDTINNILLITGDKLSVLLGPDEQLPVSDCPVAV